MSAKTRLTILTPEKEIFAGEVDAVIVKGLEGELGILYDHTPLATLLGIGVLKYKVGKEFHSIAISKGGFLEVMPQQVTVLTDQGELPDEIDVDRARQAKERALKRLSGQSADDSIDFEKARTALMRATARIRTTGHE